MLELETGQETTQTRELYRAKRADGGSDLVARLI